MLVPMEEIVKKHNGKIIDKWLSYLREYDNIFFHYRERNISLLEIGIQNGGSLEVWNKYFPVAKIIVGCDINPKCAKLKYSEDNIEIVVGDANLPDTKKEITRLSNTFDIIIDDGSHDSIDIIRSFIEYFPVISEDGIYIIEDIHASYWTEYHGGLFFPFSAISFFKLLVDCVNYEHWRKNVTRGDLLNDFFEIVGISITDMDLSQIHSVEFINSICIIRKKSSNDNVLGQRIIEGVEETVTCNWKEMNGSSNVCNENVSDLISSTKNISGNLSGNIEVSPKKLVRDIPLLELKLSQAYALTNDILFDDSDCEETQNDGSQKVDTSKIVSKQHQLSEHFHGIQKLEGLIKRNLNLLSEEEKRRDFCEKSDNSLVFVDNVSDVDDEEITKLISIALAKPMTNEKVELLANAYERLIQNLSTSIAIKDHHIDNLSDQIEVFSEIQRTNEQTIRNLSQELEESQMEVLKYALSDSWNLMRPVRKLVQIFKRNK